MLPKWHILSGAVFFLVFYFLLNVSLFYSLIVFLAAFLIDVDHYLYYVFKKKDMSLKNSYKWFRKMDSLYHSMPKNKRKNYYYAFCILHGVEPLLLLFLLAFIPSLSFLFFIVFGFILHLTQDFIYIIYEGDNPFVVSSLIYYRILIQNKKSLGDEK